MKKIQWPHKLVSLSIAVTAAVSLLSAGAAAADASALGGSAIPPTSEVNCASYLVTEPAGATSVDVTLVIEAGDSFSLDDFDYIPGSSFREEIPATLTSATAKTFTVADLLSDINGSHGLSFEILTDSATTHTSYLNTVTHNGVDWVPGQWGLDGWTFRVNDKFPVRAAGAGYEGALLNQTYLSDGDVVHFFYDFPSDFDSETGSVAANHVRGVLIDSSADSVTVQLQSHNTYIHPASFDMSVNNYSDLGSGIRAYLYDASGAQVGAAQYSDANGQVTFTGNSISAGSYVLKTDSVRFEFDPDGMWADYVGTSYFAYTGAYCTITVA